MTNHKYTVEFRVWGDTLDSDEVSRNLGLQACQTRAAGVSRFPGRTDRGMWAYNGPPGSPTEWASLEEGLRHVLDHLWPHRELFAAADFVRPSATLHIKCDPWAICRNRCHGSHSIEVANDHDSVCFLTSAAIS